MKAGKEQLKSDITTGLHKIEEKIIGCNTERIEINMNSFIEEMEPKIIAKQ